MADISPCANYEACHLRSRCRRSADVTKPHEWQSWQRFDAPADEPEMCEGWWPWPTKEVA